MLRVFKGMKEIWIREQMLGEGKDKNIFAQNVPQENSNRIYS